MACMVSKYLIIREVLAFMQFILYLPKMDEMCEDFYRTQIQELTEEINNLLNRKQERDRELVNYVTEKMKVTRCWREEFELKLDTINQEISKLQCEVENNNKYEEESALKMNQEIELTKSYIQDVQCKYDEDDFEMISSQNKFYEKCIMDLQDKVSKVDEKVEIAQNQVEEWECRVEKEYSLLAEGDSSTKSLP
ncbi:uncharacterized protein LOC126899588 [Daktulosphaira vitifoliae]|uniref:uncharacterized protein LOC126899588 n=1 Tax=Daktulosphaira vitifoliae TaxID=58002 RepID=UPI0021A979DE|nr:uncharacterized protein LOC126899588 [Daktulosphaira vitifoliae]